MSKARIAGVFAACALSAALGAGVSWRAHDAAEKQAWKATLSGVVNPLLQQASLNAPPAEACLANSLVNAGLDRVAENPRGLVSLLGQTQTGDGVSAETLQGLTDFLAPVKSGFEAGSKGCISLAANAVEKARAASMRDEILRGMTDLSITGGPRF